MRVDVLLINILHFYLSFLVTLLFKLMNYCIFLLLQTCFNNCIENGQE